MQGTDELLMLDLVQTVCFLKHFLSLPLEFLFSFTSVSTELFTHLQCGGFSLV